MRRMGLGLAAIAALGLTAVVVAKDEAKGPEVGKPAPTFSLQGSDGKTHSLADYKDKIVVLHFQANQCPWERAYQPNLSATADKHKDKVVFVGINSNKSETMDSVKQMIEKEKIPYVVLKDPGNKIADAYAARTTPHIYVIDGTGTLRYKGGVEKAPSGPGGATKSQEQYLEPVLAALVAGSELPYTETVSIGCSIKRE